MFKKENSIKIGGTTPIAPLLLLGALVLLFAIASPAAADPYLGGVPLITANGTYGTVTGDLWFDAYPGFDQAYPDPVHWETTLPCDPDDIVWARLYVDTYIGHMENNYPQNVTTEFNGSGSSYETLGSESMNTEYKFYLAGTGGAGSGPVWITNHSNRVTSDFLIWYDVTDNITSSTVSTNVSVTNLIGEAPFESRVKAIVLVVAYNNQSCNVTHYWVAQGHDTDSYKTDGIFSPYTGGFPHPYKGNTTFNTSVVYTPGEANLTVLPLASFNGNYTFNSDDDQLPWANPGQGEYFQWQSWNVTTNVTSGNDSYMTYDRNATDSGTYSGYFKIPLALLTVEDKSLIYDFSNETLGRAGICMFAYKKEASGLPPSVSNDPDDEFSGTEYDEIKYDDGVFAEHYTDTYEKRAAHRFVFNVSCCNDLSNFDSINVTWNGAGWHDAGGNSNGAYLYIWNGTGYEELDNCDGDGNENYLTGGITNNLGNYIINNNVTVLAEQKTEDDDYHSHIATDYVKLWLVDRKSVV